MEVSSRECVSKTISPKPNNNDMTPSPSNVTPRSRDVTARSSDVTPRSGDVTPRSRDITSRSSDFSPSTFESVSLGTLGSPTNTVSSDNSRRTTWFNQRGDESCRLSAIEKEQREMKNLVTELVQKVDIVVKDREQDREQDRGHDRVQLLEMEKRERQTQKENEELKRELQELKRAQNLNHPPMTASNYQGRHNRQQNQQYQPSMSASNYKGRHYRQVSEEDLWRGSPELQTEDIHSSTGSLESAKREQWRTGNNFKNQGSMSATNYQGPHNRQSRDSQFRTKNQPLMSASSYQGRHDRQVSKEDSRRVSQESQTEDIHSSTSSLESAKYEKPRTRKNFKSILYGILFISKMRIGKKSDKENPPK